jgi:hypothetical protein
LIRRPVVDYSDYLRRGHTQAIGAIAHHLCRLIWKILHQRVRYAERGPSVNAEAFSPTIHVDRVQSTALV